jgi:hypothetical protein
MEKVLGGTAPSSRRSRTKVEFVHEERSSNFYAHCLVRSYVNFLAGRYDWFISPPYKVCTSYSDI